MYCVLESSSDDSDGYSEDLEDLYFILPTKKQKCVLSNVVIGPPLEFWLKHVQ